MPASKKKGRTKKAGKGGVVPPPAHRFSTLNQPKAQAKSAGLKAWHDRRRLLDLLAEEFAEEIELADGKKIAGTKALVLRLKKTLLSPNTDKLTLDQAKLAFKFFDTVSKAGSGYTQEETPQDESKVQIIDDIGGKK
nr:MAG TPA_asm: hypothetical protein [Caudoviricetes sp.]